jgi:hypothetical protein
MKRSLHANCQSIFAAMMLVLMFDYGMRGIAQVSPQADESADSEKLGKNVSLHLSAVTMSQIVSDLSKQTGLSISAASSIEGHRVTVDLAGVTARQALDALAEMYDWRWYRSEPGQYTLDRRVFRSPRDPSAIPSEMQLALPVDLRHFLQLPNLNTKKPGMTSMDAWSKVSGVPLQALDRLKTGLVSVFLKQNSLAVHDMTAGQRDDFITWLAFSRMQKSLELLHDDPAPHKMTPKNILLLISQNFDLDIQTTADIIPGFAFGVQFQKQDGTWVP